MPAHAAHWPGWGRPPLNRAPGHPGDPHLQVVVVATQVGGDLVRSQQWQQLLDQAVGGPVLGDRPHRVVAGHQHVVLLGRCQLLLEPGQLRAGHRQVAGPLGLLAGKVVRVAAQGHGVQHEDGHGHVGPGDLEAQAVVRAGELPADGLEKGVGVHLGRRHPRLSSG